MFAACTQRRDEKPRIGVEFDEFTRGDTETVALWNEPPIDPVESACIRDAMKDLYPMPAIEAAAARSDPSEDRERAIVEKLYIATSGNEPVVEVEFFLSSALVSVQRVFDILSACKQELAPFLRGLSVARERASQAHCGWRIVFRMTASTDEVAIRSAIKRARARSTDDDIDPDDTY